MEDLFHDGHDHVSEHLKHQLTRGNEEISHWILVINCFLKSPYPEKEKNAFLKSCAGPEIDRFGRPPVVWLEDLRGYMMVNLRN